MVLWTNICSPVNKSEIQLRHLFTSALSVVQCRGRATDPDHQRIKYLRWLAANAFPPCLCKQLTCEYTVCFLTHSSGRWAWLYITAKIMQKLWMSTCSIYYLCRRFIFPKQCPFKWRVGFFFRNRIFTTRVFYTWVKQISIAGLKARVTEDKWKLVVYKTTHASEHHYPSAEWKTACQGRPV